MDYSKLEYYVSEPRLNRFLVACNDSSVKAEKLYSINLKVAQAAYPLLNLFEIFLRNAINAEISYYFNDPDWIINQQSGFMSNTSLSKSNFFIKKSVVQAQSIIQRKGGTATAGKIIAEQSFGFWTSLFEPHHFRLIGGAPLKCFTKKPPHVNRSILATKLDEVRSFRNRVYHNEPICFSGAQINFSGTNAIMQDIYDMLNWMDPELTVFVSQFDEVERQFRELEM